MVVLFAEKPPRRHSAKSGGQVALPASGLRGGAFVPETGMNDVALFTGQGDFFVVNN